MKSLALLLLPLCWVLALPGVDLYGAGSDVTSPDLPVAPNVVIILVDDLGWGDVASLNPQSAMTTPRIDSIASEGMRFTDAHSPSSVCTPTRYGLLTGRYSWRTRLTRGVLGKHAPPLIEPDRPTLGTLLQSHGYRTGVVGKWHLGLGIPRLPEEDTTELNTGIDFADGVITGGPLALGFDEFFGLASNFGWPPYVYIRDDRFTAVPFAVERANWLRRIVGGPIALDYEFDEVLDRLTEEAVAFIERSAAADAPFFLYFPLTAPHRPLMPEGRFRETTGLGAYGDFVAQVDWTVGQVLNALARAGAGDNTVVVFASDNGSIMGTLPDDAATDHTESLYVRKYRESTHRSKGPWSGSKGSIREGGHRVPLFVRWPGVVAAGSENTETVSFTDFYATLADLLGESPRPGVASDSRSLLPMLRGEPGARGVPVVHHSQNGMFALRDGRWKLVFGDGRGGTSKDGGEPFRKPWQLYDLEADLREENNLVADHPQVVTRLEASLEAIRSFADQDGSDSDAPELSGLALSGVDLGPFDPTETTYVAAVSGAVAATTVSATPRHAAASVVVADAAGETAGTSRTVELAVGTTPVTVTVTATDGTATRTYTVWVNRAAPPPVALTARFVSLPESHAGSGTVVLRVEFSEPVATSYRTLRDASFRVRNGSVSNARRVDGRSDLWEIEIAPSSGADLVVALPATTDCAAAGAVCTAAGKPLSAGLAATIPGGAESSGLPVVSVVAVAGRVVEGEFAEFRLTRTGPATGRLSVGIRWEKSNGSGPGVQQTQFPPGSTTETPHYGRGDDQVVRGDLTVTLTVEDGEGYTVSEEARSAEVVVEENDVAEFAVSVEPSEIAEGESATVRVEITNGVTFAESQAIALDFAGSTATKDEDYTVSSESLTLRGRPAGGPSWVTATLTAATDSDEEGDETVTVTARHGGEAIGTATVTIADVALVPLTAAFAGMPERHDGETAFTFELRFSEEPEPGFSYLTLRDQAFTVTGGAVRKARRLEPPSNLGWEITVEPASDAEVSLVLPETTDCTAAGAVCTAGGKRLSGRLEATVRGPDETEQEGSSDQSARLSAVAVGGAWLAPSPAGARRRFVALFLTREPVTGFEAEDISVGLDGRALGKLDGATGESYARRHAFVIETAGEGETALTVRAEAFRDQAGSGSGEARQFDFALTVSEAGRRRPAVHIPDPTLRAVLESLFGKEPGGEIGGDEMVGLIALDLGDMASAQSLAGGETEGLAASLRRVPRVSHLMGLESAARLSELDLSSHAVQDLSPLTGLRALRLLRLGGNTVEDLWPLAGLTGLLELDLSGNAITSILPLAGLTGLEELRLASNGVADLSPLVGLQRLSRLDLRANRVSDLGMLSGLRLLTWLDIRENRIEDLSPLDGLPGLAVIK